MSTNENTAMKIGHPVLGIVLGILGIAIAVLLTIMFGIIAGGTAALLGIVAVVLGVSARKGGRGIGAIVTGCMAVIVAVTMMFTTVTALNLMHKTALETGKAPVFAECFDNPYLGLSSVYFKIAGDETKLKAVTEELEALNHHTASSGIVSVSVATNAAQTNAL